LKILLVVEAYNSIGGVIEVVDHLATELAAAGHRVAIASTRADGALRPAPPTVECTYLAIRGRKPVTWRHLERLLREPILLRRGELAQLVRRWAPDLVSNHTVDWDSFPTVATACRIAGVPLVHNLYDARDQGRRAAANLRALNQARRFIAISQATRDYFAALLPAAARAEVIIGGVDLELPPAPPYAHPRPYLLCSSRLNLRDKALDTLFAAFTKATADLTLPVDLIVTGDGPDQERVRALAAQSRAAARIHLMGRVPRAQLRSLFAGALFFVMPSRGAEGLGIVFLEAMAAGKAVIGTRTGGVREIVTDGRNGRLVAEDDPEELADAIRQLLATRELRDAMGAAGRREVRQYGWKHLTRRHEQIYAACLRTTGLSLAGPL
jgi:glycosyltransferase involved in cell wall biosynthesis